MSERAINPDNGWQINADGRYEWAEGGSSGAGMVISETEPTDKVEGMQWLNPTTGLVLFWDGEKWLEMPGGVDGADGADGADGVGGLWTDNGDTSISYNDGNVGIGLTPSNWNIGRAVEVGFKGNALWGNEPDEVIASQNAYFNSGWKYATNRPASHYSQYNGTHRWFIAPSGTADADISWTQAMTIAANGKITIGNNVPMWAGEYGGALILKGDNSTSNRYAQLSIVDSVGAVLAQGLRIDSSGDGYFSGRVSDSTGPLMSSRHLIETLSTLRNATKDETVDVRQALASACDEMIEKFEAMEEVES